MSFSRLLRLEHLFIQKWDSEKKWCRICFHYLCLSGTPKMLPLVRKRFLTSEGFLRPRLPWAVKGGLFSSRKGPRPSCRYFTAIFNRQTRAQLNAKYLEGHNARAICFLKGTTCEIYDLFTIHDKKREAPIKLMVN